MNGAVLQRETVLRFTKRVKLEVGVLHRETGWREECKREKQDGEECYKEIPSVGWIVTDGDSIKGIVLLI